MSQLTGRVELYILIDGTVREAEVASTYVDAPLYVGSVEAVCVKKPVL